MDLKVDEGLKTLLESGKEKGYLTYGQVNDYLPDDAVNPEKLDQLLLILEEHGIELIDESEAEEREAGPGTVAPDEEARAELDLNLIEEEDSRRIDDPVRMYLTQMGEIPLLKREEEIALAKKIEVTRKRFRRKVLECDCAFRKVVDTLKRVHSTELPFDRTIKVSLTENLEKDKILQRMPHNLKTLDHLMELNDQEFQLILDPRTPEDEKRRLRRNIRLRRRKAVTLVEELSIRTQKIQPLMKTMEQTSIRMDELVQQTEDIKGLRSAKEDRANLEKELQDLMLMTLEEPAVLRKRVEIVEKRFAEYEEAKRALSGGNLRLVVSHRQEIPQPRPELPGPDPGGQHRPDACGRQIRVPPRLQVQHLCHLVDSPGHHPGDRRPGPHHPHSGAHDRDDEQASQRLQEAASGDGPRADHRGNRRAAGISVEETRRVLKISRHPISLDRPVGESEDSYFGDFIEDNGAESPVSAATQEMLKDKIEQVLKTLTYREREIIKLRYGLGDGYTYTLEEVGRIFKVTRERVRQIEAKAVRKLQHPVRSRQLEGFLDGVLRR